MEKIKSTTEEAIPLDYEDKSDQWMKNWKIRTMDLDSAFGDELKSIKEAAAGSKIPSVVLRRNHIYIGNYKYEGRIYPVAVYGNGSADVMTNAFTKVVVTDMDDLKSDENKKKIYVEETYTKYFIIGFYEEGRTEPSVIMQVEKFTFANSMEVWLRYLKILREKPVASGNLLEAISLVEDVTFYGYNSNDKTGCFRRSLEMLESSGYETVEPNDTSVVQMTKYDDKGILTIQKDIARGKELIDSQLNEQRPVIVGVDWKPGHTGNYDKTTDHWVIIVGRSIEGNTQCYRYFDPQTSQKDIGTSESNKLCIQSDGTLMGRYRENSDYDRVYTVTMVRPSKSK